jgi:predicted branched-subunit amino acid permease
VVVATFVGFGALARDVGLDLFQAMFVTATMFALPGQVVLADQISLGATLAAAMFAVTLTAIRLLPLTVSLMPYLRDRGTPRWVEPVLAHFVSITTWLEGMRVLPRLPGPLRAPFFGGFAAALFVTVLASTFGGYVAAGEVHPTVAAGLIFVSPLYFYISLVGTARSGTDAAALALGTVLGPILFLSFPGLDLVLTGLIGGSVAYGVFRWRNSRI